MSEKQEIKVNTEENNINPSLIKINFICGCIIMLLCLLVFANLDNIKNIQAEKDKKRVQNLWAESQEKQQNNAYLIEIEHTRTDKAFGIFKHYNKIYKSRNIWYAELQEYISHSNEYTLSPDKSVVFYDGENLYSYLDIKDYNNPHLIGISGVVYEDGSKLLEEDRKYNPNTTLQAAINRRNYQNRMINWYDYDADMNYNNWNPNEKPKIVGKNKFNGLECIMISFNATREACVNSDYGVAIYHKYIFKNDYATESLILEDKVTNIKNTEKDGFRINYNVLKLPPNLYIRSREVFEQEPG